MWARDRDDRSSPGRGRRVRSGSTDAAERSFAARFGRAIVATTAALLLGWATLEVALRLSGVPAGVVGIFDDFHRGDGRLGWTGQPDVALRFRRGSFDVLLEHGPDGFRRPEPEPPDAAPRRVLVLGDSLAWGWGVGRGDLLTDELQRRVGSAVAVENRAVCSYGTAQEMLLLEDLLARRHYDAVVLVYSRTDPVNDVDGSKMRPAFRFVHGRLEQVRWPPPEKAGRPLAGHLRSNSRAWRLVEGWIDAFRRGTRGLRGGRPGGLGAAPPETDFRRLPGHALLRELLREMHRIASAYGTEFVVAYEPHHVSPVGSPDAATRAALDLVVDACASLGIPFVDVGSSFADHRDEMVFPADGHWTAAGHRAVADALLASPISRAAILGASALPHPGSASWLSGAGASAPSPPAAAHRRGDGPFRGWFAACRAFG